MLQIIPIFFQITYLPYVTSTSSYSQFNLAPLVQQNLIIFVSLLTLAFLLQIVKWIGNILVRSKHIIQNQ